jgi:hypothetical protein
MVRGVPTTTDCTSPDITIESPIVYDDLSRLVVIRGAAGTAEDVVSSAKMGADNAENDKSNIVKIGK